MGQPQSKKPTLEDVTSSVLGIRKEIRAIKQSGDIDDKARENYQGALARHSQEANRMSKRGKKRKVDETQKLISNVTQELYSEDGLDGGAVGTNSFERVKKSGTKSVKDYVKNVEAIREEIKRGNLSPEDVVKFRKILSGSTQQITRKTRTRETDEALKFITDTENELEAYLVSLERPKRPVRDPGTLTDIEKKVQSLDKESKQAYDNKDKKQLFFILKSFETLMTDLEMIKTEPDTLEDQKKTQIERSIRRSYARITKLKKELNTESNLTYLVNLQEKDKSDKSIKQLEEIEDRLKTLDVRGKKDSKNLEATRQDLLGFRAKINSIEETSREIQAKKTEVLERILSAETDLKKVEVHAKLQQTEEGFASFQSQMKRTTFRGDSGVQLRFNSYLNDLKKYIVERIPKDLDKNISDRRERILASIEDSLNILDEPKNDSKVVLREKKKFDTIQALYEEFNSISFKNLSNEDKNQIRSRLEQLKRFIEEKLQLLGNEPLKVNVKVDHFEEPKFAKKEEMIQLENIEKEVEDYKDKIENEVYREDSQEYKSIRGKLEAHRRKLHRISFYGNEDVRNGVETVTNKIDDVLALLASKTEQSLANRKSASEEILNVIMSVNTRVNELETRIQGFTSMDSQEYIAMKNALVDHQKFLENLDMSTYNNNIVRSRADTLNQIAANLLHLESLTTSRAPAQEKQISDEMRGLKDKVNRFSGTYKNVLYKKLEEDLNKCLNSVDKIEDQKVAVRMKTDIENNLKILEQRSVKDNKYHSDTSDRVKLLKVKNNLEEIKSELKNSDGKSKGDIEILDGRLHLLKLELDNLNIKNEESEKNKLYEEIKSYQKTTQALVAAFNHSSRIVTGEINVRPKEEEVLSQIEQNMNKIRPEIDAFVGLETNQKFFELDEQLIQNTLKIDGLKFPKSHPLYDNKIQLLKDIHKYSDLLDDRVKQTEEMEEIEKEVKAFIMKIDAFSGSYKDSEYNAIDEQLINLKVRAERLVVNHQLAVRKSAVVKEIDGYMRRLNQIAGARKSVTATFV